MSDFNEALFGAIEKHDFSADSETYALASDSGASEAISGYYTRILKRDADTAGLDAWLAAHESGTSLEAIKSSLINSAEATSVIDPLVRLYQAAFGRVPDQAGIDNWADLVRGGMTLSQVADGFVGSQEFMARYPTASEADRTAFITDLYVQTLGRQPDAPGLEGWLNSGLSLSQLLIGFSESPEFQARAETNVNTYLGLVGDGGSDPIGSLFDIGLNAEAASGTVMDGKIAGATVFIDENGNGDIDKGEWTVETDGTGNFQFPGGAPSGPIVATGGTDISTGLAFKGKMEAPAGSTVVNPLTTMISKLAALDDDTTKSSAQKLADAQDKLKALLGLDDITSDLTETDFVAESTADDSTGTDDGLSNADATRLYAASVKLLNIVEQGSAAITGADGNVASTDASDAVFDALAARLNGVGAGETIDLGSSTGVDDDPDNDADDLLINVIKDAAANTLTSDAQDKADAVADSAAAIAAAANKEIDDAVDAFASSGGTDTGDTLVKIVKTQKVVQGEASDKMRDAAGSDDPDGNAGALSDSVAAKDGSGFVNETIIEQQNIGDIDGDGNDDDGVTGTDNVDDGVDTGETGGGDTTPPVAANQSGSVVTLNDVGGNNPVIITVDDKGNADAADDALVFTSEGVSASAVSFLVSNVDQIDLNGMKAEISGDTVNQLFPKTSSGQLDVIGFNDGGELDITNVDFGDITSSPYKLSSPNVWLSDQGASDPNFAGLTFSEQDGVKSILPDGLTVNGNVADALKAWWDSFDDYYAGGTNYYNDFINQRFVFLGNDYVEYLGGGNAAILDIVKTGGDYYNRQQTLHDNMLANLGDGVITTRFENTTKNTYDWDDNGDPRTLGAKEFGDRPGPSGNDGTLAKFEAAKAWDANFGKFDIERSDSNEHIRIGMLSDMAQDDSKPGQVWNGSGNSADNYRIVTFDAQEIELGLKIHVPYEGAEYSGKDLRDFTFYTVDVEPGREINSTEFRVDWSFAFSIATNIEGGGDSGLSNFVFKLSFDVDPTESTSMVTYVLDAEDGRNWVFESADDKDIREVITGFFPQGGDDKMVIIADNVGENNNGEGANYDVKPIYVAQNSQNYGFTDTFERFVNIFEGNEYDANGDKESGGSYWEAEKDAGNFVIGLEAYESDGVTLIGQNYIVVDGISA